MNRTLAVVFAALVVALIAIGVLGGGKSDSDEPAARAPTSASGEPSIATIAHRVERVRELRFKHLPAAVSYTHLTLPTNREV